MVLALLTGEFQNLPPINSVNDITQKACLINRSISKYIPNQLKNIYIRYNKLSKQLTHRYALVTGQKQNVHKITFVK